MPTIDRRTFLTLLAAGGAGTGAGFWFNQVMRPPVEYLIPEVLAPEDVSPGIPTFYNTVCTLCSAGCGITVKTREGRAKKIEGNPGHPVNQGGLCALGQAGLNWLYHPDRIRSPLKRTGARGAGEFVPVSWQEALSAIGKEFNALQASGKAEQLFVCSRPLHGHLDALFEEYMQRVGSPHFFYHEFANAAVQQQAQQQCFQSAQPLFADFARCQLIVSFGADFLHAGHSPVMQAKQFGEFRRKDPRGQLIQLEARMSATGASADQWLAITPGSEGAVALYLSHRLVFDEIYQGADKKLWQEQLAEFTADQVSAISGLSVASLQQLAKTFIAHRPAVALLGDGPAHLSNGLDAAIAIQALNHLSGSTRGEAAVLYANPQPLIAHPQRDRGLEQWRDILAASRANACAALVLHECNPLFDLPPALGIDKLLTDTPLVVAFSSLIDESNAYADWILPVPSYLERWDDASPEQGVGFAIGSIAQPVVAPLYDTRSCGDILLSLAHAQGAPLPHSTYREYLMQRWQQLHATHAQQLSDLDFNTFWQATLTSGVWGSGQQGEAVSWQDSATSRLTYSPASFAGAESEFPQLMQLYPQANLHHSLAAALPWLQELPDPMTGVVYESWLEINPNTAASRGWRQGDVVRVESPHGVIEAPLLFYPGIHPDMLAMAIGRGHQQLGRYAKNRGSNPLTLTGLEAVQGTNALAWSHCRVRLTATGKRIDIPRVGEHERSLGRNLFGASSATIPIKEL